MLPCLDALDAAAVRQLGVRTFGTVWTRPSRRSRRGHSTGSSTRCPTITCIWDCWRSFSASDIHPCRRELRNVAVSCWMTNFQHSLGEMDPEHMASRCLGYRRLMEHWDRCCRCQCIKWFTREMVDDLETVARRLVDACGLEWEPGCGQFHRTDGQCERPA